VVGNAKRFRGDERHSGFPKWNRSGVASYTAALNGESRDF
jgi:hypothetical protein